MPQALTALGFFCAAAVDVRPATRVAATRGSRVFDVIEDDVHTLAATGVTSARGLAAPHAVRRSPRRADRKCLRLLAVDATGVVGARAHLLDERAEPGI